MMAHGGNAAEVTINFSRSHVVRQSGVKCNNTSLSAQYLEDTVTSGKMLGGNFAKPSPALSPPLRG